ncbi:MAG: hypothetical protein O2958_13090 [Gemmatimonadetes bacterium]|nr:hypothetical protein [Gemmatimonadota bacterium]MDA1103644.1 hypothetical protein [Gemmatimonadota bacterium]
MNDVAGLPVFSRELLTFALAIDFVNRSRVVDALAPGRQMGVQVGGRVGTGANWSIGTFSGPPSLGPLPPCRWRER